MRQALERAGYSISTADNGDQALERIRQESFDVALLDLRMPGLPGMDALKRLKQESPNMAVIIITGYGTIDSAVEAIKSGAYDYLAKPFTPEALTYRFSKPQMPEGGPRRSMHRSRARAKNVVR